MRRRQPPPERPRAGRRRQVHRHRRDDGQDVLGDRAVDLDRLSGEERRRHGEPRAPGLCGDGRPDDGDRADQGPAALRLHRLPVDRPGADQRPGGHAEHDRPRHRGERDRRVRPVRRRVEPRGGVDHPALRLCQRIDRRDDRGGGERLDQCGDRGGDPARDRQPRDRKPAPRCRRAHQHWHGRRGEWPGGDHPVARRLPYPARRGGVVRPGRRRSLPASRRSRRGW